MPIDLDAAEGAFADSTDLTVGLEEEFAILDPGTLDLVPGFELLRDGAEADDPALRPHITGELISSEIEIISGRGEHVAHALELQRDARRRLFAHAARHGLALAATGTHPWADYREQPNIDTEHYRRVVDGLGYVARRNNTFSLHVHVGVQGTDRAIRACDRLRDRLPTLLALSANSPFLEGHDTLLHSARTQTFTKSFPRCGVPDAYGDWAGYRRYLEQLIAWNSIVEYTQVWWSVRPHLSYGTVEIRICDAQSTAEESDALTGVIVATVAQILRDIDEGVPHTDHPPRLVEENVWRAIRHGLDGRLVDLDAGREVEARAAVEALWDWTEPARASLGADLALPTGPNGAQRQRAAHGSGSSLRDVYASAVQETSTTYGQEPVTKT